MWVAKKTVQMIQYTGKILTNLLFKNKLNADFFAENMLLVYVIINPLSTKEISTPAPPKLKKPPNKFPPAISFKFPVACISTTKRLAIPLNNWINFKLLLGIKWYVFIIIKLFKGGSGKMAC